MVYITNSAVVKDLDIRFIKDEINKFSIRCIQRLNDYVNPLAIYLWNNSLAIRQLKRFHVSINFMSINVNFPLSDI